VVVGLGVSWRRGVERKFCRRRRPSLRTGDGRLRLVAAIGTGCHAVAGVVPPQMGISPTVRMLAAACALFVFPGCGRAVLELFPDDTGPPDGAGTADGAGTPDGAGTRTPDGEASSDAGDEPYEDAGTDSAESAPEGASRDEASVVDGTADQETLDGGGTEAESGALPLCATPCPDMPSCENTMGVCVECIVDGDCATVAPDAKCNRNSNTCESPCTTSADCSYPDVCDTAQKICADCLGDSDCSALGLRRCVQETCVACASDLDCPAQYCFRNTCVDCVTDAQCSDGGACGAQHTCM
jgi:hypothetical protein